MAYSAPHRFSHGEYPTAANINKYKDGLDDLYARLGSYYINPFITFRKNGIQSFWIVHNQRWLLWRGTGWIEDPSGIESNITLTGDSAQWFAYDLSQVEWLIMGKLYQIQNVDVCFEDFEAW